MPVEELPLTSLDEPPVPDGYKSYEQRCWTCNREFLIYVPQVPNVIVPRRVTCPYGVHGVETQFESDPASPPILVQGFDRTKAEWNRHRAAQLTSIMHEVAKTRPGIEPGVTDILEKIVWLKTTGELPKTD